MPAQSTPSGINLLPKSEFDTSFWGRILKWALTAGRYIIILTELVVIIAFMSRFKLDKDLADLGDSITGKKAILEALGPTEKNFRHVQAKLASVDQLLDSQLGARSLLDHTLNHIPPSMTIENLTLTKDGVTLTGRAPDKQILGEMLQRIRADKTWHSLELSGLSADISSSALKFTLKAGR